MFRIHKAVLSRPKFRRNPKEPITQLPFTRPPFVLAVMRAFEAYQQILNRPETLESLQLPQARPVSEAV